MAETAGAGDSFLMSNWLSRISLSQAHTHLNKRNHISRSTKMWPKATQLFFSGRLASTHPLSSQKKPIPHGNSLHPFQWVSDLLCNYYFPQYHYIKSLHEEGTNVDFFPSFQSPALSSLPIFLHLFTLVRSFFSLLSEIFPFIKSSCLRF